MRDRVVVITGASSGIGASVAEKVGTAGGRPVLVARRADALAEVAARSGPDALAVVGDMTVRADVERAMATAVARFGRVDAWINNAGRGISRPVTQLTDADVDEMMAVNLKSALYGMQVAVARFKAQGAGHVINVSSMLGRVPFAPIRSVYSASKHALNALTAALRMELRADWPGITVSSVHPGVVATGFGESALHGGPASHALPGAQPVGEVADVIVALLEHPRADVYTRPGAQQVIVDYFAAEDMAAAEAKFGMGRR
jgi:NAD(P)-dependent dehydrogenase (short-subunit alcohol dehydrogenase family)